MTDDNSRHRERSVAIQKDVEVFARVLLDCHIAARFEVTQIYISSSIPKSPSSKSYIDNIEKLFIAEKLGEVGRELSETQSNLSQTATDMRGSADIFSRSAATEKALKEEQERTSQLMQELTRLKFQQEALELDLKAEKEKTHDLLTAKNTAERDSLLKQKRADTLEELTREQTRIIEQLQHVQQEKENLLEKKRRLENLLKKKLKLEGSIEGEVLKSSQDQRVISYIKVVTEN